MTRHWLTAALAACLITPSGGCSDDGSANKRDRDAQADKPDAGDDSAHDGGGGDGDADAGKEHHDPIEGGEGCGEGSLCLNLRNAYAQELQDSKGCMANADESCGLQAPGGLGCVSCPVWVTDTSYLDELAKQFDDAGCDQCFYDSPTGDRCHPVGCNELGAPMCDASGTCVPDLSCPEGVKDGGDCKDSKLSYCGDGQLGCICFGDVWMCS
jgi:hypothetical protein